MKKNMITMNTVNQNPIHSHPFLIFNDMITMKLYESINPIHSNSHSEYIH